MKRLYQLGPIGYKLALEKEIIKRHLFDLFSKETFAYERTNKELPYVWKSHSSLILRKLHGVDFKLQLSKQTNIEIASSLINGIIINPNETFSFWKIVGKPTKERGFRDGLVITTRGFEADVGGGLCQMANMIHYLILHSPLDVTELHHHTDALFPDSERRVPFGTGTSICYNAADYRFKNNTKDQIQLLTWCEDGYLNGELRSIKPLDNKYRLVEENHHYKKEQGKYYRNSKVYRIIINKETNELSKELVLNNHSEVMYDYSLIPKEQIEND